MMEDKEHQALVNSLVSQYAEIDKLAARILEDKQQIVDLDHKRNKTREALRQIDVGGTGKKASKSWMCLGNTFLKIDSSVCKAMLNKDKETLDTEIEMLREGLKPKVAELHKMEGASEVKGFELKGMKIEDMLNITVPDD